MSESRKWHRDATVYQIYPKSFNDSNGDGTGDIPGITERLDYIESLGVDAVWLNPVYPSPNADNGYDISHYREIHPEFGTMEDWEQLRDGLHDRGIKLLMDMVMNHTSDEHRWFQKSRRREEFKDWYIWREGTPEKPPNNWESFFGGSAWSWDEEREAWYLHLFHEKQPDLNWRNPEVRREMKDIMEFWIEKDVDGFRLDVLNVLSKTEGLPDGNPENKGLVGSEHFINGPHIHEYVSEVMEIMEENGVVTVGEMPELTIETAEAFMDDGLDMVFQFDHLESGRKRKISWDLYELREIMQRWQGSDAYEGVFLANHDQPRAVSRFGSEQHREKSAKALMTLVMTLRGTPFVYQGEEIGMTNFPWSSVDEAEDIEARNRAKQIMEAGGSEEDALEWIRNQSRDNARTPMQWNSRKNAGFTSGKPWLPVNPNYHGINVEESQARNDSVLKFFQELVELRKEFKPLRHGNFRMHDVEHSSLLAFWRESDEENAFVAINLSNQAIDRGVEAEEMIISNYGDEAEKLRPWEARVYRE